MSIDNDAREFGLHVRQGGWRLGLLVARNVVRGTGQGAKTSDQLVGGSKVSASKFAGAAGLSGHSLVLRYFDAWERAAKDGEVPAAADLSPGEEPELDVDSLPDWGHYYSAAATKPEPAQPVSSEPETERPVTQPEPRPAPQPTRPAPTTGRQEEQPLTDAEASAELERRLTALSERMAANRPVEEPALDPLDLRRSSTLLLLVNRLIEDFAMYEEFYADDDTLALSTSELRIAVACDLEDFNRELFKLTGRVTPLIDKLRDGAQLAEFDPDKIDWSQTQ